MKIETELFGGGAMTLADFAEKYGLTMRVMERSISESPDLARYCASFYGVEERLGGMLMSAAGNGATPEAAIADYAARIAGRRLVLHAYGDARVEFVAPNEWLPETKA